MSEKTCVSCKSDSLVTAEISSGSGLVCESCGVVQDCSALDLRESCESGVQNYRRFHSNDTFKPKHRKKFFNLFKHFCSRLNTNWTLYSQAELHIAEVYAYVKPRKSEARQHYVAALLYLVHRANNVVYSISQFARCLDLDKMYLAVAVRDINSILKLFSVESRINMSQLEAHIESLAHFVLSSYNKKVERHVIEQSLRLANIIVGRSWHGNKSQCDPKIAGVSVIISGQSVTRCKRRNIGLKQVALHLGIKDKSLELYVSSIKKKLYEVAETIPWKPSTVNSHLKVHIFLDDVLKELETTDEVPQSKETIFKKLPEDILLILIGALKENLRKDSPIDVLKASGSIKYSALQLVLNQYISLLTDFQKSTKSHNESQREKELDGTAVNKSYFNATCQSAQSPEMAVSASSDSTTLETCNRIGHQDQTIKFCNVELCLTAEGLTWTDGEEVFCMTHEELRLVQDLVKVGCPDEELTTCSYLELAKKYLDEFSVSEETIDEKDMDEEELATYISEEALRKVS